MLMPYSTTGIYAMRIMRLIWYHQQQNKWYPKCFYLPISKLHFILAVPNLLAHNIITISYYVQVNSLWPK